MNCKYCNAELGEEARFCPNCGKPVNEPVQEAIPVDESPVQETMDGPEIVEKKKMSAGKIALAVGAVVVLLAVLIAVIVGGLGGEELIAGNDATIAPTSGMVEDATEGTVPPDGNPDDVTCKGSYTVSDEELIAAKDKVVATMGDKELTLSQLQVYYWLEVVYFLQEYSDYAAYLGLDYTKPMDTQICTVTEEQMTWQQYFLDCALESWSNYQAMALEAEANNLEMEPEMREALDDMIADMDATALEYGMENAEELIRSNFDAGATVESYVDFWELYYYGYTYYNFAYENMEISEADVEAYFAENEASYAESGITKDSFYVDVRHILLTVDEETEDSEAAWEACRQEAQDILDKWLAGDATEDTFAEMANEYSEDPGSNTEGGLYEDVFEGEMVPAFNDWCFDESRQYGDYGLVQTEYGYHIMYFVDTVEGVWYDTAEADLLYEMAENLTPEAMAKHPHEIDYASIMLGVQNLT